MSRTKTCTEAEVRARIDEDFARWEQIAREGCSDPYWPDGVNLNLKRNHIICDYRLLAEVMNENVQLSMFDEGFDLRDLRPIPPKVPENFMVRNGKHSEERIARLSHFHELVFDMVPENKKRR